MRLSKIKLALIAGILLAAAGCQFLNKSSESSVDAQLTKTQPPSAPIPMTDGEPQKGFEQEPAGER